MVIIGHSSSVLLSTTLLRYVQYSLYEPEREEMYLQTQFNNVASKAI